MGISKIKQVTCDYCSKCIDCFSINCPNKTIKTISEANWAIIAGNLIFCDKFCRDKYFAKVKSLK